MNDDLDGARKIYMYFLQDSLYREMRQNKMDVYKARDVDDIVAFLGEAKRALVV